jgi:hypothetical protein
MSKFSSDVGMVWLTATLLMTVVIGNTVSKILIEVGRFFSVDGFEGESSHLLDVQMN